MLAPEKPQPDRIATPLHSAPEQEGGPLSRSSGELDSVNRESHDHEGIVTRRHHALKERRDALALSKMATWLAQKR